MGRTGGRGLWGQLICRRDGCAGGRGSGSGPGGRRLKCRRKEVSAFIHPKPGPSQVASSMRLLSSDKGEIIHFEL